MSDITLTTGIRSNLLSLQNTSSLIQDTQFKLSTGKKVNSALDDPISFFKAQNLNFRAADLAARKDGIIQAQKTIEAADKGIDGLISLVEQAQSIAEQAAESGDKVSKVEGTAIAGAPALSGNATDLGITLGDAIDFTITGEDGSSRAVTLTLDTDLGNGDATLTVQEVVDALDGIDSAVSFAYEIDGSGNGTFTVEASNGWTVEAADNSGTPLADLGINALTTATTFGTAGTADMTSLQDDYNAVLAEIAALVEDAGYQGTNLLNNDSLDVTFNADRSNEYTIDGVDVVTELGLTDATWTAGGSITADITLTNEAITKLRGFASSFGTDNAIMETRREFTEKMVNTLENGAAELVNADMNEESANMLALQTRQQMGTISLSIANQAEQSVLRLF